jgi:hypothetical protein
MLQTFAVAHGQLAEWASQPFGPFTHFCTISTDYLKHPPETPDEGILHSHASACNNTGLGGDSLTLRAVASSPLSNLPFNGTNDFQSKKIGDQPLDIEPGLKNEETTPQAQSLAASLFLTHKSAIGPSQEQGPHSVSSLCYVPETFSRSTTT